MCWCYNVTFGLFPPGVNRFSYVLGKLIPPNSKAVPIMVRASEFVDDHHEPRRNAAMLQPVKVALTDHKQTIIVQAWPWASMYFNWYHCSPLCMGSLNSCHEMCVWLPCCLFVFVQQLQHCGSEVDGWWLGRKKKYEKWTLGSSVPGGEMKTPMSQKWNACAAPSGWSEAHNSTAGWTDSPLAYRTTSQWSKEKSPSLMVHCSLSKHTKQQRQ